MGVVISRDSELGKELAAWDTPRNRQVEDSSGTPTGIWGKNCVGFEPYPKMLYRAQTNPQTGQVSVGEVPPHPAHFTSPPEFERASLWVESFNRSCQMIVRDEGAERIAKGQGWSETQTGALERYEQEQITLAELAAKVAFQAKRMSPEAQAELAAADAETDKHVVDVVPQRKHGKAAKGIQPVTG
jgi:hypothetical protein